MSGLIAVPAHLSHHARSSLLAPLACAFAAICATLRTWRQRDRERTALAAMSERERNDRPRVRDFDIGAEISKPF